MYLHIVPKLYHLMANQCSLKSIFIPELGFKIEANELSIGRPFPNKNIYVGMRKGRKATTGIILRTDNLLRTDSKLNWFTTEYVWNVEGMGNITHRVTTYIEDNDFDMVSQYVLLNGAFDKWKNRIHPAYEDKAPVYIQPMMESFLASPSKRETCDMWTEYEWGDFLNDREESFLAQTIESERLNTKFSLFERVPSLENAIDIKQSLSTY